MVQWSFRNGRIQTWQWTFLLYIGELKKNAPTLNAHLFRLAWIYYWYFSSHICAPHIYNPRMWAKMMCAHTIRLTCTSPHSFFHLNMTFAVRIFFMISCLQCFLIVDRYIVSSSSRGVINNSTCLPPDLGHISVLKNEGKNV